MVKITTGFFICCERCSSEFNVASKSIGGQTDFALRVPFQFYFVDDTVSFSFFFSEVRVLLSLLVSCCLSICVDRTRNTFTTFRFICATSL